MKKCYNDIGKNYEGGISMFLTNLDLPTVSVSQFLTVETTWLYEWFHDLDLKIFSFSHLIAVIIAALGVFLTLKYSKKIAASPKGEKIFLGIIFIALLVVGPYFEIKGNLNGNLHFPLHLCTLTLYFTLALIIFKKEKLFDIVYFTGILGAIVTFIVPDGSGGINSIAFYTFLIGHLSILIVPIYFYKTRLNWAISLKKVVFAFSFIVVLFLFDFFINSVLRYFDLGSFNYMYTHALPHELEGVLPAWPFYIPFFLLIAFVLFYLIYFFTKRKAIEK